MIAFLVSLELDVVRYHLLLRNVFEHQELRVVARSIEARSRTVRLVVERALATAQSRTDGLIGDSCRTIGRLEALRWRNPLTFILQILKFAQALCNLSLPLILLKRPLTNREHPFPIDEVTSARTTGEFTIDALPLLFEIRLYVFQSVECGHLGWFLGHDL